MTVRPIPPTDTAAAILAELRQNGGVLQTSFFTYDVGDEPSGPEALAREALSLRYQTMVDENAAYRAKLSPGTPCWTLSRPPGTEPRPTPTTLRAMLGPGWDPRTGTLALFSFGKDYQSRSSNDHTGLPRALLNPPYGLRVPGTREWPKSVEQEPAYHAAYREALRAYVEDVLGVLLLGGEATPPICLAWSTDWTSFFDAGREWWGTFCWTVQRPADRILVVLMASSTD